MRIDILSAVPDLLQSFFEHSILKRANERNLLEVHLHNLHDYSAKKFKQIDDYQFGGGAGMVMCIEPILKCIESLQKERRYDEILLFFVVTIKASTNVCVNTLLRKKFRLAVMCFLVANCLLRLSLMQLAD